jgi:peptidyl-dipeptidase A
VVPRHLKEIGLLKGNLEDSKEQVINAQMAVALSKISILPWTYMIDLYRWRIFSGEIKPEAYQTEWENLMQTYQGIARPFPSGPDDFDAGSVSFPITL